MKSETLTCFYEEVFIREFMELRHHEASCGLAVEHHSAQRLTVLQLKTNTSHSWPEHSIDFIEQYFIKTKHFMKVASPVMRAGSHKQTQNLDRC